MLGYRLVGLVGEGKWVAALKAADAAIESCPKSIVAWQYRADPFTRDISVTTFTKAFAASIT